MTLRRLLLLTAASDLQVQSGGEKAGLEPTQTPIPATANHVPTCFYLCHGSRVMIDVTNPEDEPIFKSHEERVAYEADRVRYDVVPTKIPFSVNNLLDWVGTFEERVSGTHDISRTSAPTEIKTTGGMDGLWYTLSYLNPLAYASSKKEMTQRSESLKHFGCNVAMYRPDDTSVLADGSQGHIYMFREVSPEPELREILDRSCMIGIEESAPGHAGHSLTGAANPVSATGGKRLEDMQKEECVYEGAVVAIPDKYNGMRVHIPWQMARDMTKLFPDKFVKEITPETLTQVMPCRTPAELMDQILGLQPTLSGHLAVAQRKISLEKSQDTSRKK